MQNLVWKSTEEMKVSDDRKGQRARGKAGAGASFDKDCSDNDA